MDPIQATLGGVVRARNRRCLAGPCRALSTAQCSAAIIACRACRDCTLQPGHAVFVYGGIPELGNWQERHAVQLQEVETPRWEFDVTIPCTSFPFTYRCAIRLLEHACEPMRRFPHCYCVS